MREGRLFTLLALAALAPRAAAALLRPPWHDEYFTAWLAGLPVGRLIAALRLDSGPPLPYLATRAITLLGFSDLAAARTIAVTAGTAAVVVAAVAAYRAFGPRSAAWCGALLAFHPLAVAWSAEGRAYPVLLLASAWAWERLEAIRHGRPAWPLAAALSLALWSHGLGLAVAGASLLAALSLPRERRRPALMAVGVGMATFLPWLPATAAQPPAAIAWMTESWQRLPLLERFASPILLVPPISVFGTTVDLPSAPLALGALALVGFVSLVVLGARAGPAARSSLLLFAVPAFVLAGLAWAGVPAFFPGRSEAAFLAPAIGICAAAAGGRRFATAALAVLVLGGAATTAVALGRWGGAPPSLEERLSKAIAQQLPSGGAVITTGYWFLGLWYHLDERFVIGTFPGEIECHPGWFRPLLDQPSSAELDHLETSLQKHRTAGRPVALVVSGSDAATLALRQMARSSGAVRFLSGPGLEVYVLGVRFGDLSGA